MAIYAPVTVQPFSTMAFAIMWRGELAVLVYHHNRSNEWRGDASSDKGETVEELPPAKTSWDAISMGIQWVLQNCK